MKFIPNACIQEDMLKEMGLTSIDDLFADIPKDIRINALNLPTGKSQQDVEQYFRELEQKNVSAFEMPMFLGGGVQPHYIPAIVQSITSRAEFYTAYTPYQPEASQGFLQAMFEYQSMIANLTGMDIANASLYDGMTALGEAALLCHRHTKKHEFLVSENISWEKRSILQNYVKGIGMKIRSIPFDKKTGAIDIQQLKQQVNDHTAGIYVEHPNFFGVFETHLDDIRALCTKQNALFIMGIHPLSLGVVQPPGSYDADIVIGEGRCLGNPMDLGGSTLGIFACKQQFLRQLPGRIIGLTKDAAGKQAFCMTMQTREQHIRRGRATSNICTNEGLCALAAVVYLSWLGASGLTSLGNRLVERASTLKQRLLEIDRFSPVFSGAHFNEFVLTYEGDGQRLHQHLLHHHLHGGLPLHPWYPNLSKACCFGVSELTTDEQIDHFIKVAKEVV